VRRNDVDFRVGETDNRGYRWNSWDGNENLGRAAGILEGQMLSIRNIIGYAAPLTLWPVSLILGSAASISDVVVFQEPGQPAVSLIFDEGGAAFTATPFLTRLIPFRPGLQDTLIHFTESINDPDQPIDPNHISDILGLKVTPAPGNQQQIQLSFWSDNLNLSAAQFELSLGLVNPGQLSLPETGALQDVNASLFGVASPFTQLLVGSDVNDTLVGDGDISGDSDFVSLQKNVKPPQMELPVVKFSFDDKSVVPEYKFDLTNGVDVFPRRYMLSKQLQDAILYFSESINDEDSTTVISDILTMHVMDSCTVAPGCLLYFSFWSEGPLGIDEFLRMAQVSNLTAKQPPFFNPEISHPSVEDYLFGDLLPAERPFDRVTISSDPPVPEPQTHTLISGGLFAFLWYARKRYAEKC
jgi:hypothetical protein